MTLKDLYVDFVSGTPVKRKVWKGYWKYHYGKIEMYCKNGKVIDIKDTEDILFTVSGILADDWEIATSDNCTMPIE